MSRSTLVPSFPPALVDALTKRFEIANREISHDYQVAGHLDERTLDQMLIKSIWAQGPVLAWPVPTWSMKIYCNYIGGGSPTSVERGDVAIILNVSAPKTPDWHKILILQSKRLKPDERPPKSNVWRWDESSKYEQLDPTSAQAYNISIDPLSIAYALYNPCTVPIATGACPNTDKSCSNFAGVRVFPGRALLRKIGSQVPRYKDVAGLRYGGSRIEHAVAHMMACRIGTTLKKSQSIIPFREGRITERLVEVSFTSVEPIEMIPAPPNVN